MGEVRTVVESKAPTGMMSRLREVEDHIGDMIQIKLHDLATEGAAMAARNQRSVDKLKEALKGIQDARAALQNY